MDDYELLPHEELENLRKEVERLKKSPFPNSKQNKTLLDSMTDLTLSINKLIKIFEGAQDEVLRDYTESNPTKLLKEISAQNAKIAEGIVAVANMVKNSPAPSKPSPKPKPMPPLGSTGIPPANLDPTKPTMPPVDTPTPKSKTQRKGMFSNFQK